MAPLTPRPRDLKTIARRAIRSGGFLMLAAASIATSAQALMKGDYAVTARGAASYRIPITVPPGVMGLEPSFALSYGSNDGNQIAGVGFAISGLSAITRCPQTRYQDGAVSTVNYTTSDRFCLDGGRLMLTSGTYGADGAEYRTEIDEIAKVVSSGTLGSGPASFTVYRASGEIDEYGTTTDSQTLAATHNAVRVWALHRVRDRKGNYYTISYTQDRGNGQFYPSRADYTGNLTTGLATQSAVTFDYETRPDPVEKYFGGDIVRSTVRLKTIHTLTSAKSGDVLTYSLTYDTGPSTNFSRLRQVTQCAGTLCLPPTAVTWDNTGVTANTYVVQHAISRAGTSSVVGDPYGAVIGRVTADMNGDGLDDVVNVGNGTYINNGGNSYSYYPWTGDALYTDNGNGKGSLWAIQAADMDGDGKQDIVVIWGEGVLTDTPVSGPQLLNIDVYFNVDGKGQYRRAKWISNSNLNTTLPQTSPPPYFRILPIADVDGDGRPDLVVAQNVNNNCDSCIPSNLVLWTFRNTGSGLSWSTQTLPAEDFAHTQMFLTDINGDGRADLLIGRDFNTDPITVASLGSYLSTGTSFTAGPGIISGAFTNNYDADQYLVGDFNGDGYPDVVRLYRTGVAASGYANIEFAINTGYGFGVKTWSIANAPTIAWPVTMQVRDSNGDGRDDLVNPYMAGSSTGIYVFRSTGTSLVGEQWLNGASHLNSESWLSDEVDGQGSGGIVHMFSDSGALTIDNYKPSLISRDRVASISTSGVAGYDVQFQYQTLPALYGTQYKKDATPAFPLVPLTPTLPVVTTMTLPDGHATRRSTTYSYGALVYDEGGRGNLGFAWQRSLDSATGISAQTSYNQVFPYTGLVKGASRYVGDPSLGPVPFLMQEADTYTCTDSVSGNCAVAPGKYYYLYVGEKDVANWDLDRSPMPGSKTTTVKNAYGETTSEQSVLTNPDGTASTFTRTETSVYLDDAASWLFGRPVKRTVTRTAP